MALEPAGISLEARNFNKYISQLSKIEKTQKKVFNVDSRKIGNAFSGAEKSAGKLQGTFSNLAGSKGIGGLTKGISALGPISATGFGTVATAALGAAAAIGAATVASFDFAQQTDDATNEIAANLGISTKAAEQYNDELQNIFIDNPKAQFIEIADAIALTERALDIDTAGLEQVAGDALKISQQFNQDLPKTIGAAEQLIERFGVTGQQATDLLAFGLQNIPADDLIDSIGEYSSIFAQAGFSADTFFSVLQSGVAGGVLGTDRIADAVKEFQIRFLEGNKSLKDSFQVLGLNFDQLTAQVSTGQKSISDVFGIVVDRAGQVDLSVAKNRAAIAGLGTQFEDLGASAVAALDTDAIGFEDIVGASDTLDARFNNINDTLTRLQRAFLVSIAPIGETLLDSLKPALAVFSDRVIPAFEFARQSLERLIKSLGLANSSASVFEGALNGVALVIESVAGGIEILARVTETLRQIFAFARAGGAAFGSIISDVFNTAIVSVGALGKALVKLVQLDFAGAASAAKEFQVFDFKQAIENAEQAAVTKFKEITIPPVELPIEAEPAKESIDKVTNAFGAQSPAINTATENLASYEQALKEAENLQRSFAREAEDTALKLTRANEDIAKKQGRNVAKLGEKQAKNREKLLKDQQKELDKFETDRKKQIAKAEAEVQKERKQAAEQRKRDQKKLQRELAAAREQFNLSQLQSERRFALQEKRLIAEGDILAIQQLREDRELERQEEKENFAQGQKDRVQSADEQQREQAQDLESRVNELKTGLEDQRAELLKSFDEQLAAQVQSQAEAKAQQIKGFQEQAEDRAIALAREEEDRRISQQRQLEDLGRSLAEQEGVTEEGVTAIAGELEKVFGTEGVADNIFSGFKARTESDFIELFSNLESIVSKAKIEPVAPIGLPSAMPDIRARTLPAFDDGGIVPGPIGSPQIVQAHGGETILPTHKSFAMSAPVIPSQTVNVAMSGGFNISGDGQADEQVLKAAVTEMTENFKIAVQRVARKN